jgi:hypothetical protein
VIASRSRGDAAPTNVAFPNREMGVSGMRLASSLRCPRFILHDAHFILPVIRTPRFMIYNAHFIIFCCPCLPVVLFRFLLALLASWR